MTAEKIASKSPLAKPALPSQNGSANKSVLLKICHRDKFKIKYRLQPSTPIGKATQDFLKRSGIVTKGNLKFLLKSGSRGVMPKIIGDNDTLASLGISERSVTVDACHTKDIYSPTSPKSFADLTANESTFDTEVVEVTPLAAMLVKYGDKFQVKYKIHPLEKLEKMMEDFAKKSGLRIDSVVFFLKDQRLKIEDTPESLNIVNNNLETLIQVKHEYELGEEMKVISCSIFQSSKLFLKIPF